MIGVTSNLYESKEYSDIREVIKDGINRYPDCVAFTIKNKEKLFKKNILLIDDVYTTGATINECKKNIEKCNINKIYLLTIAKSNI